MGRTCGGPDEIKIIEKYPKNITALFAGLGDGHLFREVRPQGREVITQHQRQRLLGWFGGAEWTAP